MELESEIVMVLIAVVIDSTISSQSVQEASAETSTFFTVAVLESATSSTHHSGN